MRSAKKALSNEAFSASDAGLRFLLEPEPWLRIFARNIVIYSAKRPRQSGSAPLPVNTGRMLWCIASGVEGCATINSWAMRW